MLEITLESTQDIQNCLNKYFKTASLQIKLDYGLITNIIPIKSRGRQGNTNPRCIQKVKLRFKDIIDGY